MPDETVRGRGLSLHRQVKTIIVYFGDIFRTDFFFLANLYCKLQDLFKTRSSRFAYTTYQLVIMVH